MKRVIALLALAALAAAPASALGKPRAKVYRGSFSFVGGDGDYTRGKFGKVQLVDGKRNDKLSVHVRRLARRATYSFRLQTGVCREGASGGSDVAGWTYRRDGVLRTSRRGVANSWARSKSFSATESTYAVRVFSGDEVVLCAELRTKSRKHGKSGRHERGDKRGGHRGKRDDARGKHDKQRGKHDKQRGKRDDPRGKRDDAQGERGKRDDAPSRQPESPGQSDDRRPDSPGHSGDAPRGKPQTPGKSGDAPRGRGRGKGGR